MAAVLLGFVIGIVVVVAGVWIACSLSRRFADEEVSSTVFGGWFCMAVLSNVSVVPLLSVRLAEWWGLELAGGAGMGPLLVGATVLLGFLWRRGELLRHTYAKWGLRKELQGKDPPRT